MDRTEALLFIAMRGGILNVCHDLCMYSRGNIQNLNAEDAEKYYMALQEKLVHWSASPDVFSTRYDEAVRSLIEAAIEQYIYRQAW